MAAKNRKEDGDLRKKKRRGKANMDKEETLKRKSRDGVIQNTARLKKINNQKCQGRFWKKAEEEQEGKKIKIKLSSKVKRKKERKPKKTN